MPAATVAVVSFDNHCRFQLLLISSFDQIDQNLPGRPPALNAAAINDSLNRAGKHTPAFFAASACRKLMNIAVLFCTMQIDNDRLPNKGLMNPWTATIFSNVVGNLGYSRSLREGCMSNRKKTTSINKVDKLVKEYRKLSDSQRGEFLKQLSIAPALPSPLTQLYISQHFSPDADTIPLQVFGNSTHSIHYFLWCIEIEARYDRGELTEYLKALLTMDQITVEYQQQGHQTLTIEYPREFLVDKDRKNSQQPGVPTVILNKGTPHENAMDLLWAYTYFRDTRITEDWLAFFEQLDQQAPAYEALFSTLLPFAMARGAEKLLQEFSHGFYRSDAHREVPAHLHNQITHWQPFWVGRKGPGGSNPIKDSAVPGDFVIAVDNCFDLVREMKEIYMEHQSDDWRSIIRALGKYQSYVEVHGDQHIDELMELLPRYIKSRHNVTESYKKSASPLAFACQLAAREIGFTGGDGKPYMPVTLLTKYREAGGQRRTSTEQATS
jgi:hypothetical protein